MTGACRRRTGPRTPGGLAVKAEGRAIENKVQKSHITVKYEEKTGFVQWVHRVHNIIDPIRIARDDAFSG